MNWLAVLLALILGFVLGFMTASWAAYQAKIRARVRMSKATSSMRAEVLRLLDALKDVTEVKITVVESPEGDIELNIDEKVDDDMTRH